MNVIEVKDNMTKGEVFLSKYATKSSEAVRLNNEPEDFRPPFFHDIDRVIHSMAYTRYIDKTQVFSFSENDHVSKRMIHVQLVSKIARTIGRMLNLNEDLIEAIGLGHDIGHTPIGHVGEHILDEIARRELNETFFHNIQSVRVYKTLENNGVGNNLTVQVLDGIMCHNGELVDPVYKPQKKSVEDFLNDYNRSFKDENMAKKLRPMTLEGCVVRISDIIAYLGRDIEDAIRIGRFNINDIPTDISEVLGNTNKQIVNNIVCDIIENSYDKPYIKMSDNVFNAIIKLKTFNSEMIYKKANSNEEVQFYREAFNKLYNTYLMDLEYNRQDSVINSVFLHNMSKTYKTDTDKKRIVIDFISGMTDEFFLSEYNKVNNGVNRKFLTND